MAKEIEKPNIMYQKALEYAVRGYSIMPLARDKKPLLSSWKQYQTTPADEEQITKWWEKWPDANVGIITGKISGLSVVDIDTTGGDKKIVPLSKFPQTLTVATPSGGYHLWYEYNVEINQTSNTFPQFPHVDIRNDGGYIVAPPSKCEYVKNKEQIRGMYSVLSNLPIAPFPLDLFVKPQRAAKKPSVNGILKNFDTMAEGDGRNVALTKVVGKILKLTMPDVSMAWELTLTANARFKKPLEESEAKVIFDSISKKEQAKPLAGVEFLRTDKGVIISNMENVFRTIQSDANLVGRFRVNTFAGSIETNFNKDQWDVFQRVDITRVRGYLMSTYSHFVRVAFADVEDAMMSAANANRVSPPAEWMKGLKWDGVARLDTWLKSAYNVEDNIYHQKVGSNWFKGMVKRGMFPGCKFDYVLVLEGPQGIRKSTSLGVIGGDWHIETVFTPDNKDFFMQFGGNLIVEFSEGETLNRTEAKKLKAVITMQHDKYRPPYDRSVKDFPRQCVFAMTTNQDQYLKDETGNRRWLPVAVKGQANIDWLIENRDQLFAEAYHRVVVLKETVYEFPQEEMEYQQSLRQTNDPRYEVISEWYYTVLNDTQREEGVTTRQAFIGALQGNFGNGKEMGKPEEMIIGSILKEGLKLERRREMIKGTRFYLYRPTKESEANKPTLTPTEIHESTMRF